MDVQNVPVNVVTIDGGFKMTFAGPIHINVTWIEREIDKVVAANPRVVELDLVGTEHISSLGLGLLVGFNNRIRKGGGVVKVVAIRRRTLGILKVAFLDKLFTILPDAVVDEPVKQPTKG